MALESERPDEPTAPEPSEPPAEEEPIAPDEAGRSEPVGPAQTPPDEEPPAAEAPEAPPAAEAPDPGPEEETVSVEEGRRAKPEIPGADLEVDIVPEGYDPLAGEEEQTGLEELEPSVGEEPAGEEESEAEPEPERQPSPRAVIDLASGARYRATGKRKTAVARVILRPGDGRYAVNGRSLEEHFPRPTLQRNIRQPLETVGYDARMDVVATLHGGGTMAQAGALRHGISRALIEADPNLRGELKRRGFLTRDPRVKERKKAGLKKARKRPQFSKR
jgi:small subunit ribosomal protein S9